MKVAFGCDHGGFKLKEVLKNYVSEIGVDFVDFGTHSEESVDYPDFAARVVRALISGEVDRGILICGTGIGMSMFANRIPGVRAALCYNVYAAEMSRRHNDANVIALGGRVLGDELAKAIVFKWLHTPFDGGRHSRRVEKVDNAINILEGLDDG